MDNRETLTPKQQPERRISRIVLAVVITAVISVFISFAIFYLVFLSDPLYLKLRQIDLLVGQSYYGEVDDDAIENSTVSGYIDGLGDRFAGYFDVEGAKERNDSLSGNGKGIGIIVIQHPDTQYLYVDKVYDNCPAAEAGLLPGDQIVAVDGKNVVETGYTQAVNSIIREIGETVELTLLRDGSELKVTVEYSEFSLQSVFYNMTDDGYGYLDITAFNSETVTQFENAINQLMGKGAKALIFDLRSNGGGTVDSVIEMVDFICPEGVIMTVKYGDGSQETLGTSDSSEIDLPMVVLTDGATASAAELFTASVKDFGKGISVGTTTFGKGVMQTTYPLYDGSSVAFTVAEFFPHSGNSFNGVGISPDIEVELTEEQYKYRYQLSAEQDPVLQQAIRYLNENEK